MSLENYIQLNTCAFMVFQIIIPFCDYQNMGSFPHRKSVKRKMFSHRHAHIYMYTEKVWEPRDIYFQHIQ